VAVNVNDNSDVVHYDLWHIVRGDDIEFARGFEAWCGEHEVVRDVGVLFIETSHHYEYTINEIHHWFHYLFEQSVILFTKQI